jgi:hypothetical protein
MIAPNIPPPACPPADIFELAALASLAEWWGWSPEDAFLMAVQLRMAGMSAAQAAAAFRDALRRLQ